MKNKILDPSPAATLQFKTKDGGQPYCIPVEGSLGVLALGDLGIIAWRQKRRQFKLELAARTQQHLQNKQA
ncbi:MAG TPA: hypothetical protein ENJ95_14805 [Bacteroidetes bacterium]|nr:hypothetical protein [Bacteroidota bacterium]